MSQPSTEVIEWVKHQLNDITGDGTVSRIQIYHDVEGQGLEIIGTVTASEEPFDTAQELWDAAEIDASTRMAGRMQRYVMIAYKANMEEPCARFPFLMNGQARNDLMGGDTEGPNATGHLAQLMRHDERMHQTVMQITETTTGRLMRDLEAERGRRVQLEDRQMAAFEMMQELQDRKHERDMERMVDERKQRRHDEMMALLMSMAPLVIAKVLGPAAGVMGPSALPAAGARDESIHQFLKSLSEEEAMKILGVLPTGKQMALIELYKAHKEEEERRDAPSDSAGAPH